VIWKETNMSDDLDIPSICAEIAKSYSPCDVSDALLTLHVPAAGYLRDISPIPHTKGYSTSRLVAPISTVLFVDNGHSSGTGYDGMLVPTDSNLPKDMHFSDHAPTGSVVLMQQPTHQIAALLGDIVATRYKSRGVKGCVIDGRSRDIVGCSAVCSDGEFQCWAKALTSPGTSLQAKPWAVDVPLKIGDVTVQPGDILVADEAERVCCVIPIDKLKEVTQLLPVQKEADDGLLKDVQSGMGLKEAIVNWPKHYSNH
jgi:regulator of RNase E activity RraA